MAMRVAFTTENLISVLRTLITSESVTFRCYQSSFKVNDPYSSFELSFLQDA